MSYRWQRLKKREKRVWLRLALLDAAMLTAATLIDPDYFLAYLAVVAVVHAIDAAFFLTR